MEKALQLMNIKLSGTLSDIGGISGMDIIRAIVQGEKDPVKLANLRNGKCKKPEEAFIAALTGNFQKEHIFSLKQALDLYDFTQEQLNECDQLIEEELKMLTVTEKPIPMRDKDKKKKWQIQSSKKAEKKCNFF